MSFRSPGVRVCSARRPPRYEFCPDPRRSGRDLFGASHMAAAPRISPWERTIGSQRRGGLRGGVLSANRLRISPQKDPGGFGTKFHTVQVAFEISTTIPLKNTASSGTFEQSPASLEGGPSSNLNSKSTFFEVAAALERNARAAGELGLAGWPLTPWSL